MKLLIDTDAFCKLAIGNILDDAVGLFLADLASCGRLPALPYMLRKGRLRKILGVQISDGLICLAESIPVLGPPDVEWFDKLASAQTIDPGEAQLYAVAAASGATVISGDKRALRSLKEIAGYAEALTGRIVVLEALLVALCDQLGVVEVGSRVQPLLAYDKVVGICFSPENPDPRGALFSYYQSLATELEPLVLWNPCPGELK